MKQRQDYIKALASEIEALADAHQISQGAYTLLRDGTNLVFKNEQAAVVARVSPAYMKKSALEDNLKTTSQLVQRQAPLLKALTDEIWSLKDGQYLTFWPFGEECQVIDKEVYYFSKNQRHLLDGHAYAQLVKACHSVKPPPLMRRWQPSFKLNNRLSRLKQGLKDGMPRTLVQKIEALLKERLQSLTEVYNSKERESVFIHGDVYYGNILVWQGQLLFCDLDDICLGPPERDLMTAFVDFSHDLMKPHYWQQFVKSYGASYDKELFQSLLAEHEVALICWLAGSWAWRPESQQEIVKRLQNLGRNNQRWYDF